MKRLLCLMLALFMAVAMLVACAPQGQDTDNDTSLETDGSTNEGAGGGESDDNTKPSDPPITDSDNNGEDNNDTNGAGGNENKPQNPDAGGENEPNEPQNPDVGGGNEPINPDDGGENKPAGVEISISKTADEMAESIGKYNNSDIVSGEEIMLDSNICVSFGKGTANTEPALYSGAIRIYQNGGTLTVNARNGREIKTIVITFSSEKSGSGKLTVSGGSAPVLSGNTLSITANDGASTITITVGGSSKTDRLYVESIEVIYIGQEGDSQAPINPENPDVGGDGNGDDENDYLYYDFTDEEKSIYNEYVGFVIPFLPNDYYEVDGYDEEGYSGVYYSALCEGEVAFALYRAMFSSYSYIEEAVDDYGQTWYCYTKNGIYVDVCYYEYEGEYYIYVDAWLENGGTGDDGNGDDESDYLYYDFTDEEKSIYNEYVGFVIPFLPNNDYYFEKYEERGYRGVYYSALCESDTAFNWYRAMFSSYQYDGTDVDEYGDTMYLYSNGDAFIDIYYYEYEGAYYVDVDAYSEINGENGGGDIDNGEGGGSIGEENVITNAGAGLPNDDGDGIYDISFGDADNVKDVTDQGYYIDGCPTVGSPGVLVIPVEFSDRPASKYGYDIENIKNAFLKDGQTNYYSVYDYYYISSMGQLTLDITVVDEWFRPSGTSTYYSNQKKDGELIGDQMVMDEALAYLSETMDLSKFDSDSNGIIDAVVLVTTLEIDGETDFYWAYRYWNLYTDEDGFYYEYDEVSANDYLWASYSFIHEDLALDGDYTNTDIINPYTFIHEFGHVLGTEDYYDTTSIGSPLDGYDIMDSMVGDHNAYTKFNLGWIESSRLVVTGTSVTLTLEDFSKSGDTIILANNWDASLGAYQEYYILVYYTNSELNSGMGGYFDENGILVYHINASLFWEEYEGEIYYDVYNTNTDASDYYGTENNLIELIANGGGYIYTVGDTMATVKDDLGKTLGYTFTVDALSENEATLTISAK